MPRRGYRKGVSDRKVRLSRKVYVRVEEDERTIIEQEAAMRGITMSAMVRNIITAPLTKYRTQAPHRTGPSKEVIREVARVGNNLNQLTRQANSGIVAVSEPELRKTLNDLTAVLKRL